MKILNLTQHKATQDQLAAGVIDVDNDKLARLKELLIFESLDEVIWELESKVKELVYMAKVIGADACMIGGAPFLMHPLHLALTESSIIPLYAFSVRVSTENEVNGEVVKSSVFKHVGFVK